MAIQRVFLMTIFCFGEPSPWFIQDTGIFSFVGREDIAITETHQVWITDRRSILHFDAEGKRSMGIGEESVGKTLSRGSAPGSFKLLKGLQWFDNRLYAIDSMAAVVQIFDEQSQFIHSIHIPRVAASSNSPLFKIPKGWVYIDRDQKAVVVVDDRFKNGSALVGNFYPQGKIPAQKQQVDLLSLKASMENPTFYLAEDQHLLAVDSSRGRLFVYQPERGFEIQVFDSTTKAVTAVIRESFPAVRVPGSWVEKIRDEHKNGKGSHGLKAEVIVSEFFPAIATLHLDAFGNLWVLKGTSYMFEKVEPVVYDSDFKRIEPPYSWSDSYRVLVVRDGWAYVAEYADDADDAEFGLRKLPVDEVTAYLNRN